MTRKDVEKEIENTFKPCWNLFSRRVVLRILLTGQVNAKDSGYILYWNKNVHHNLPGIERSGAPHFEIKTENDDLENVKRTPEHIYIESINQFISCICYQTRQVAKRSS